MGDVPWGFFSVAVNVAEFFVLIWLLIHLRHAAGPVLAVMVEAIRREQDIMRGNLGRLSTDTLADRHARLESHTQVWEELRRIHARLDEMHCPLSNPDCPLNHREG